MNTQVTLFLVTLAGWMNRKQQSVIDYLLEENRVWGKVIGLVRPMRLIDRSLQDCKREALEYASPDIFSGFGGLDEP